MELFFINIYDYETDKYWTEKYYDYESFRKRVIKLNYSKRLVITSRSLLESEK